MRPDIALRIVDINRPTVQGIDWHSPVAKQYHVRSVPAFKVYGPNRQEMYSGAQASTEVRQTLHDDME